MEFPFKENQIEKNVFLREFKENIDSEELIWHRDKENRKNEERKYENFRRKIKTNYKRRD